MCIPNKANYNDNSSGVIALLHIAKRLSTDPALNDLRPRIKFVLFDLEEWGLLGSSFMKRHWKRTGALSKEHIIINLDCVGNGEYPLICFSGESLLADCLKQSLIKAYPKTRKHHARLYPLSDDYSFKKYHSASIVFVNNALLLKGCYIPNVHTRKDMVLKKETILSVTACLLEALKNDSLTELTG